MERCGVVVSTDGQVAEVLVRQHSACAACGKCNMAHESRELKVQAHNPIAARPGDKVRLAMPQRNVYQAGLIAYIMPLLLMFLGVAAGQIWAGQSGAVLGGLSGLLLAYFLIARYLEPRLQESKRFNIMITHLVDEEGSSDEAELAGDNF